MRPLTLNTGSVRKDFPTPNTVGWAEASRAARSGPNITDPSTRSHCLSRTMAREATKVSVSRRRMAKRTLPQDFTRMSASGERWRV